MEQVNQDHRPVTPIDMEAIIASLPVHDTDESAGQRAEERVMLRDPSTGHLMHTPVPKAIAAELQAIFDRMTKRVERADQAAWKIREVASEMANVGLNLRALHYLFDKAVVDDGIESPLFQASHLVSDIIKTMAERLDAMDDRATAAYANRGAP